MIPGLTVPVRWAFVYLYDASMLADRVFSASAPQSGGEAADDVDVGAFEADGLETAPAAFAAGGVLDVLVERVGDGGLRVVGPVGLVLVYEPCGGQVGVVGHGRPVAGVALPDLAGLDAVGRVAGAVIFIDAEPGGVGAPLAEAVPAGVDPVAGGVGMVERHRRVSAVTRPTASVATAVNAATAPLKARRHGGTCVCISILSSDGYFVGMLCGYARRVSPRRSSGDTLVLSLLNQHGCAQEPSSPRVPVEQRSSRLSLLSDEPPELCCLACPPVEPVEPPDWRVVVEPDERL